MKICVVKLGGSLLDLVDWRERFERFRVAEIGTDVACVLVVGGGRAADLVREFCERYGVDDKTGHELAVRAMGFNAAMIREILPRGRGGVMWLKGACGGELKAGLYLVEPVAFLMGAKIPRVWEFTSDSIAAYVAEVLGAERLVLLKSVLPVGETVADAAREGVVDGCFEEASAGVSRRGAVALVNLRSSEMVRRVLR